MVINEASALGKNFPKTGNAELDSFITTLSEVSLDDEKWNDLFRRYVSKDLANTQYFYLKVSKGLKAGQNAGYIKYSGETGISGDVGSRKSHYTIDPDDLDITAKKDEASAFTEQDINIITQAIKSNKDIRTFGMKFQKESVPEKTRSDLDYARLLFRFYFERLCEDSKGLDYIRGGESNLYNLTRQRRGHPLAGNDFLKIFSEAFKNADLKEFRVTNKNVIIFNNLIADGMTSSQKLMKPNTFLDTICFNNTFERFSTKQVEEIRKFYREARELADNPSKLSNAAFARWDEVKTQLPRYLVLAKDIDEDPVGIAIRNNKTDLDAEFFAGLEKLGTNPSSEPLLTWTVRDPNEINSLINILHTSDEEDEQKHLYLITDMTKNGVRVNEDVVTKEDYEFSVSRRLFKKDMIIKFVFLRPFVDNKGSRDGLSLKDKFNLSALPEVEFLDDDTLKVKKDFLAGIKGKLDVRDEDAPKIMSISFMKSGDETPAEEPEEASEPEEEETTGSVAEEDTAFDVSKYIAIEPVSGEDTDDRRTNVKLKVGDRFSGLNGKIYEVKRDGSYDIQKGSKVYIEIR